MLLVLILRRSSSGIFKKNSQFSRSGKRNGGCGIMLMAFSRVSGLFLAGQMSTQMPQPVQSSGATWMVYLSPAHSLSRASVDLNVLGTRVRAVGSETLIRITACGHTIAHFPHCMQVLVSQTGISRARFRFSHFAVPTGTVASAGNELT